MAYATKYLFKWESVNGTTREIRVLLDGYSGSVIQRRLGRAPVLKKQHNGNVYGTSLEFYAECTVDGEFAEFYTTDPKAYRVDLYSGNTLLWQGYITPELYAEPDIAPPYDVQVIATDGVGELKLYDFAPQGLVSLRSMLTYLLGYTGLTTDVYLISSIKPGGSGAAGSLLEKTINLDYMAGKSCYEVLSYILDTLHATITWWKGAWILARETNVKFSSGKVQYFNTSGNAGTLAGSVVALGKMYTNDAWPVGQLSSKIDPAKNSVRIQAPWHPVTALSNPDMTSDTGWTKTGGAAYDSTNHAYHLPAASLSAIPRISQTLSLSSLKNPMTLAAKVTGVSADLSLSTLFTAAMGFYVTYEVSGTTYHLERSEEGLVWKQGAMPSLLNYTNTIFTFLKTFDEDRTGAQTVDIEIPPFLLNNAFPAGTLAVYVFGGCVRVYGASLDVIISKGYQDNLYLDNDARGEGDEVEIAIGRETSAISPYQAFLQGILLDSGSLITSFKDDYITSSGLDFMSFIARDYARSFALPRIVQTGTVSLESSVTFPPLVFTKGALDYWLEGYSWNMLDDELDISARSLPTATITVDSETVTEAGGTASSAAQGGSSSGGGSSINPVGGTNYFQIDEDLQTLLEPKPQFDFLSPKKGLIFDSTPEADVASSPAHLMLRNLGTAQEPNYALYTPYALITGDDQIVGSGTPGGGGGGGASYLYQLNDTISTWTAKPSVSATQVLVFDPSAQDKESSTGAWKYVPATDIGRVYSGGTGITIDQNTNEISVTANTYLPLTGGTLTGGLNIKNDTGFLRFLNSSGTTKMEVAYYPSYGAYIYNAAVSGGRILGIKDDGTPYYNDGTAFRTLYHSGNFSVTLNGTATTSASFYAPTSAGDTAGQVCVWSSGAPAWTSATKGSATQPIYLSGGVLTAGTALGTMAYASTGDYLPLTAGSGKMLTDDLWINKTSGTPGFRVQINSTTVGGLEFDSSNTVTLYSQGSNFPQLKLKSGVAYPVFRYNSVENTVYHSGNSNSTSVAWSASSLTLGNALYLQNNYDIYWKDSGGTYRSMAFLSAGNSFVLGSGLTSAPSGGYLILRGAEMRFQTCALGGTLADSMWINSSGNVTVGTSDLASTSYKLYVNGATYINGAISGATTISASNGIVAGGDTSGVYFGSAKGGLGSSYTGGLAYVYGNNPLYFYTASAQRMIITGGGNVGIGTDSPDTRLHTVGAANAWTTHFQGSGSVMQVHMCYPNIGAIITSSRNESTDTLLNVRNTVSSTVTSVLYVRGDGNVGIGTTSPWKNLDVIGELYAGSSTAGVVVGRSGAKIDGFTYNSWGTSLSINSLSSGNVIIATGGGNVGVGTSSPGYKCEIVTTEDTAFALKRTASGGVFMDVYPNNQTTNKWRIGSSPTSTDYVFRLLFNSNTRLELSSSGTLTTTGDQVISSDITLKKNIKDLDLTVEQIAQLPAVTFDWKDGRGSTFGTVAQGVLPIFPQAVRGNEGNYSVVYGQGGWVFGVKNARAIVDIQAHETEQDKEIKKLKDKVAKQNAEILRLKARLNMN